MSEIDEAHLERLRRAFALRLDARGRLTLDGAEIAHAGIASALRQGLDLLPSGEPVVRFGAQWAYVRVEDCLFRVCAVLGQAPARPYLRLDDGRELPLRPEALDEEPGRGLRVRVPTRFGREAWARFENRAQIQLSAWFVDAHEEGAPPLLWVDGRAFPIASRRS